MKTILKHWLLIAVIITGFSGLLEATVQQVIRQAADDPQIQMAEDIAAALTDGQQVQNVVPAEKVDIAKSLATYIIVFDANGKAIASSAQLDGQIPTLPAGVFDYVKHNGEDRITWQPQTGVRSAIVVTQFQGSSSGFVLAGRSLREVEKREDDILQIILVGWVAILLGSLVATAAIFTILRNPLR
nr:hypothetical protein [Ktedonobacteraceae bacterium]